MDQEMSGKKWVLLVAGSKGWENYQHQANVCCHYQLVKRQNIPDEQIVTMMYDDITDNAENPHHGSILSVLDNSNVYKGVVKDYTEEQVTPENFLEALQGKEKDGKVIKSCKDDNIFIYMNGLGSDGTFKFPDSSLLAKQFIDAIQEMTEQNKFSKMIIFMDSSYSASMFHDELAHNDKVFVLTSCSLFTETTPTDYDKERGVYLSDKFSSAWLDFLNKANYDKQTFHDLSADKQSEYIAANLGVCPCRFGKLDPTKCLLKDFLQQ